MKTKRKTLLMAFTLLSIMIKAQTITTIAGNGTGTYAGDAGQATAAELNNPNGIAVDAAGNIYFADGNNNVIRKVTKSTGVITTVVGTQYTAGSNWYYGGDGGPADSAWLGTPLGIALDAAGNIYIADNLNNVIRKVTASTGIITTVAGNFGTFGGMYPFVGDGGPATSAELNSPWGVALDAAGNIYIADLGYNVIRKVTVSTGIITTVVGDGNANYYGDGGQAISAELNAPDGVTIDAAGNIYISDDGNNVIRKVTASTGIITTIAGTGTGGYSGDGGAATSATLNDPSLGVAIDAAGNIYITDDNNNVIRKVTASTGIITTIAGTGTLGYAGDNGMATAAMLNGPEAVALDAAGNIYIADGTNNVIRKITVSTGSVPSAPVAILGSVSVCYRSINTYSVAPVSGATNYTWILPNGWSGISTTNIITATAGTSGTISVTANNSYGSSLPQTLIITVNTVNTSVTQTGLTLTANATGADYAWINCNGNIPISGATNQSFTATTSGNYAVIVTQNSCSDTSACFSVNNTICTISISGADLPYSGLSVLLAEDTVTNVPLNAGISQTWNYSMLINNYNKFAVYNSTSATPYASAFPASNLYTYGPSGMFGILYGGAPVGTPINGYIFWKSDTSGLWETGFRPDGGHYAGTNVNDNPLELLIGTPASYGSVFNNSARWVMPIGLDTFYVRNINKVITADACGALTTPYGYYPTVLREHEHLIQVDSVYFKIGSTIVAAVEYKRDTLNNYTYVVHGIGYPVCIVHADKHNTVMNVEYYSGTFAAGINQVTGINNQVTIYPNPSNGNFMIETNSTSNQTAQVYDVNGKMVLSQPINGKTNIDASSLNEGVYNISIISLAGGGVVNKRIVIVR